jgi:hypothetical protein
MILSAFTWWDFVVCILCIVVRTMRSKIWRISLSDDDGVNRKPFQQISHSVLRMSVIMNSINKQAECLLSSLIMSCYYESKHILNIFINILKTRLFQYFEWNKNSE